MGYDVLTKRCGCGNVHPCRQTCTACIDRKREEAKALAGPRYPAKDYPRTDFGYVYIADLTKLGVVAR